MRHSVSILVVSAQFVVACATGGVGGTTAGPVVSQSDGDCPPSADERPYTISVSNRSGDSASVALRQSVANALAAAWGEEERDRAPKPAAYHPTFRELAMQLPRLPRYGLGKSRMRSGDTAVALLTYRRGQPAELDLPATIRPEFHALITRAMNTAVASAVNGHAVRDTFPLEVPGSGSAAVTLEVRFGWTPPQNAAVATFALRESLPTPHTSREVLRYPDEYRLQNIEGSVLMMFIITETGNVDRSSIRVITSDGPLFAEAVKRFLTIVRYRPYRLDCVVQALVVSQQFNFSLTR